jgi:serine/threonine protein kinase
MITVKKTYEFNPETDLIGKGGFGKVYRALDRNLNMQVALKKYSGNLPAKYSLFEEIKRAIRLNHPNLVRYYDAFELEEASAFGDKIQMGVLEYVNGGDLMGLYRKKPDAETLKQLFVGIMDGLRYLHRHDIIHRDLKPENILIQNDAGNLTPKIADFGISKALRDADAGASSLVIGSVEYMAPEQFNAEKYGINKQLHTNLDLWSLGVMISEAFSGYAPFGKTQQGLARDEIMRNILTKDLDEEYFQKIPEPFKQVVKRCLVRDAAKRALDIDELLLIVYGNTPAAKIVTHTSAVGMGNNLHQAGQHDKQKRSNADKFETEAVPPKFNLNRQQSNNDAQQPTPTNSSPSASHSFSFWQLFPLLTGLFGWAFYNSKQTLFGYNTPIKDLVLYPIILCGILLVANLIVAFIPKRSRFPAIAYLFSFLSLIYYLAQGILERNYSGITGFTFTFKNHIFAQFYPIAALVFMAMPIVMRPKHFQWFDVLCIFLGYTLFTYWLIGIFISETQWQIWVLISGIVAIVSSAMLWQKSNNKAVD